MISPDALTPGVRRLVAWCNANGFETTDSGDGATNVTAGMECALDFPHVIITCRPEQLVARSQSLKSYLGRVGVNMAPVSIEAVYSPVDGHAHILLHGLDDSGLP